MIDHGGWSVARMLVAVLMGSVVQAQMLGWGCPSLN